MSELAPFHFLNLVNKQLRRERAKFSPPEFSVRSYGDKYAEIWFPTSGCRWDLQGSCTMCNYGHPEKVSSEQMIHAVEKGLSELEVIPQTLWVSSFNVLDDKEVPPETRRKIFGLLSETKSSTILFESHPETISYNSISECVEILGGKDLGVEIGIESMNDFVRNWCINKRISKDTIVNAVNDIHKAGAICYGNFLIGAPFLSVAEMISDVVSSIEEADRIGIDRFVIFPNHVKPYTLVKWLHDNNLYNPPSLILMIQIMKSINATLLPKLFYSWIEPINHPGKVDGIPPRAGNGCLAEVVHYLQDYLENRSDTSLDWLFQVPYPELEAEIFDPCRQGTLLERLTNIFPKISRDILGVDWWHNNGEKVLQQLKSDWDLQSESLVS